VQSTVLHICFLANVHQSLTGKILRITACHMLRCSFRQAGTALLGFAAPFKCRMLLVLDFFKSRIGRRGCSKFLLVTLSACDCICNQCVYLSFLLLIQSQKACHRLAAVAKTSYTRRRYTKYFAD
jgi:hypothetical protein